MTCVLFSGTGRSIFFISLRQYYSFKEQQRLNRPILSSSLNWIFFILVGNNDNHKSLDEFVLRRNFTTDFGVSCPLASEKSIYKLVSTLVPSF